MKVLTDTSIIRHLELVGHLGLFSAWHTAHAWEFVMPETVRSELEAGGMPAEIERLLESDQLLMESCHNAAIFRTRHMLQGLGGGELEALCIVDRCEDRAFRNYLILTDDVAAQKAARRIGMSLHDVFVFLLLSNKKGLLTKDGVTDAVEMLERQNYCIPDSVKTDYMRQIR